MIQRNTSPLTATEYFCWLTLFDGTEMSLPLTGRGCLILIRFLALQGRFSYHERVLIQLIHMIVDTLPNKPRLRIHGVTFHKMRNIAMRRLLHKTAFSRNTHSCEDVVASAHNLPDIRIVKLAYDLGGRVLELVLENDKADELKIGLCVCARHLLHSHPVESGNFFGSTGDHAETSVGVETKEIVEVDGHYRSSAVDHFSV